MVTPEDVTELYQLLSDNNIPVWLTGGWGIDALLGDQTRLHKDLDLLMQVDEVGHLCEVLGRLDFALKDMWPENLWVIDRQGDRTMSAFVLYDCHGRELDVHAMWLTSDGKAVPAWHDEGSFVFTQQDRVNEGSVSGKPVRCHSAGSQMLCHTGYSLPAYQVPDLVRLHEKFGVEYPGELAEAIAASTGA